MTPELVNLPWQIQLALASGYAADLLACVGRREGHKAIDTAFMTLVFGLFATGALYLLRDWPPIVAGLAALIGTCGAVAHARAGLAAVAPAAMECQLDDG